MQTPAEKYLIEKVVERLRLNDKSVRPVKILNIGAGKDSILEKGIQDKFGASFICDRLDVVDCRAQYPAVGRCLIASVESMPEIESGGHEIAFANYVLEHVENLPKAAAEIARVLAPAGYFISSLPNPIAPEFLLSKYTPTKFHQLIKGKGEGRHAHETRYAYGNIKELIKIFDQYFSVVEIRYWPILYEYLYRFPLVGWLGKIYDGLVKILNIKMLMGNVCVVLKKK